MLVLSGSVIGKPVISLRTSSSVATVVSAIINPNSLKIEGFYCSDNRDTKQLILLYQDIRDLASQGFIINDYDVLAEPKELVRLKDILELDFQIIGKKVVTISKQRLGKVSDYAIETSSMYIQKFYASQSILKSLSAGSLSIDRSQVVEITNSKIVINDLQKPVRGASAVGIAA